MELRVLLLELPQVPEGRVGVCPLRQQHLIGEHRLQGRCGSGGLDPQALSGPAAGEARDRADGARRGLVRGAEPGAGVDTDLVRLLLPHLVLRQIRAAVGQHRLDPELPAGDLQIGQAVPLAVPGDLEDPGAEVRRVIRDGGVPRQAFQESSDPLQLQGGAEPAGKQLPRSDHLRQVGVRQLPGVQIPLQHRLVADGGLLPECLVPGAGEVHDAG